MTACEGRWAQGAAHFERQTYAIDLASPLICVKSGRSGPSRAQSRLIQIKDVQLCRRASYIIASSSFSADFAAVAPLGDAPQRCIRGDAMLKEFREFAMRGNAIDLAVGVILGAAFGKIVSSLVNDILMPPFGLLLGNVDFSNIFINLSGEHYESLAAAKAAGAATVNIGLFVNAMIDFVIVAFAIFVMVRQLNRLTRKPAEAAVPTTKECPYCCSAIPLKATRCPACTSELTPVRAAIPAE